ncbi:LysM peptidoglycan-binding domain-containing protein [Glaciibacter psychrotolerans]|uniref:LysM repeat protein n=1 Tax=Glaciibacter psychrotolerans TaxID=670054 RepID=A0A7Z0J518_9MICO|nr:LysM peptidoglycan-binding domain-containing protein [Leifsonia psychrotolerans]NYJ18424.1 LysM repeat protein [Leifsonia psychrotolerans]
MSTTAPHGSIGTTRLRLTRRGRLVFSTLAAAPLVAVVLAAALNGGAALASGAGTKTHTFSYVTITAGQSLWQLAERLAPHDDPRDVIAEIVALNQLDSADVVPGQRLALPASD